MTPDSVTSCHVVMFYLYIFQYKVCTSHEKIFENVNVLLEVLQSPLPVRLQLQLFPVPMGLAISYQI